jgi:transcriptional regulator with XRE-family HTH domain
MPQPIARLTPGFLARAQETGLSDAALAAAIGVTKQFYSQVKNGQAAPSTGFLVGAVMAGLAKNFGEVAEVVETSATAAA